MAVGEAWAWGWNHAGQLGGEVHESVPVPRQVLGVPGVASIAPAGTSTYMLCVDGSVWAVGEFGFGGPKTVQIGGVSNAVEVVAKGLGPGFAVTQGGELFAWGSNNYGELGLGDRMLRTHAVQVPNVDSARSVVSCTYLLGGGAVLVLRSDDSLWGWTYTLGSDPALAEPLHGARDVTYVAAANPRSIVALQKNGRVLDIDMDPGSYSATIVPDIADARAVAAGRETLYALRADGTVWAWGGSRYGQAGDGSTEPRPLPTRVAALTDIVSIAATDSESAFAISADGTVWAWGVNHMGQLGDGSTENRATPVQVRGLANVRKLALSRTSTYALLGDGTVWAWGNNDQGQLGDGSTINRSEPVRVLALSDVDSIFAGSAEAFALKRRSDYSAGSMSEKSSQPSGGCYIATAVYGSYDCPQVWVLRRFRDQQLERTSMGRNLIRAYYFLSPRVLARVGASVTFTSFMKWILDRLVSVLRQRGTAATPYRDRR